jgi:hypothetical protein
MRFSGGTMDEVTINQAHSTGSQRDLVNTESGSYLQVRVEQSIVVDAEKEGNKGFGFEAKSNWDPGHSV